MSVEVGPVYVDVNVVRTIARRVDFRGWNPWGVMHNPVSGHILVTDWRGHCIRVFSDNPPYTYITQYGREGRGVEEYRKPYGITCNSAGRVIVADIGNRRLQVLSPTGQYLDQVKGITWPECVCVDGEDNIYVVSGDDDEYIRVYNPQGEPLPSIRRRGRGDITISGEHLYEVDGSNNHRHIHIHSLTDRSNVKSVPLPQQIPKYSDIRITACRDGRLLITARGWRARSDDDYDDIYDDDDIDTLHHSYMYVLDGAGHNLTPRPYRYEGSVMTTTLLYDNTLVVADGERRLQLVTLPSLSPPLRPLHTVRVASLQNLCLYKIRSKVNTADGIHTLYPRIAPPLVEELSHLYI